MSNPTTPGEGPVPPLNIPTSTPNITVAVVEVDGAAFNPSPDDTTWTDYMIVNRYESDLHRYMAGLTSPNGFQDAGVAFFQLAAPTLLWVCDWTACQYGAPPQVPDPFSVGDQWVLLDVHLEPAMVGLQPDGVTPVYRFSGTYFFGNKNPGACENYYNSALAIATFPRAPWLEDTFARNVPQDVLLANLSTWQGATSAQRAAGQGVATGGGVYPGWPGGGSNLTGVTR